MSDRNEREVRDLLIKYLQKIEGTYSTTLEQDIDILEEIYLSVSSPKKRMIFRSITFSTSSFISLFSTNKSGRPTTSVSRRFYAAGRVSVSSCATRKRKEGSLTSSKANP